MKLEIALLLVFVSEISALRSIEFCRRQCGYSIDYVCSTSGVTYDNECMLRCDFAIRQCDGRCPCHGQAYRPYPIFRGFAMPMPFHVPYHVPDYSTPDCVCPKDKDYVCTTDNETYDNSCEAACDRKLVACDGRCPCKY